MRVVLGHLRHHSFDPPDPRPPAAHLGSGDAAIRLGGSDRNRQFHSQKIFIILQNNHYQPRQY